MKLRVGTTVFALFAFVVMFFVARAVKFGDASAVVPIGSPSPVGASPGELSPIVRVPAPAERESSTIAPEPERPAGTEFRVHVYSRTAPSSGARVDVQGALVAQPAITSGDGVAVLRVEEIPDSEYRRVRVSADGYFPAEVWARATSPRVDVLLEEPGRLSGVVLDMSGSPPPVEMTVLAWPVSLYKDLPAEKVFAFLRDGATALPGDRIRTTKAKPDGSFVLEGLQPGVRTFVAAGGPGWATLVSGVRLPVEEPVNLEAKRVFGAQVTLVDEQGQIASLSETLALSMTKAWGSETEEAVVCDTAELAAALAGLDPEQIENTTGRVTCMYLSDSSAERIGPCVFRLMGAGYKPIELEFEATSVALGLMPVSAVLERIAASTGSLSIIPSGVQRDVLIAYEDAIRFSDISDNFLLELRSSSEAGTGTLSFGVELDLEGPNRITDIPVGLYEARLRSLHQLCTIPPADSPGLQVEVVNGSTTEVVLDLSICSTLTLEFRAVDGSLYNDEIQVTIARGMPSSDGKLKRVRRMMLDAGPYVIGLVTAGPHTIRSWGPSLGAPADGDGYYSFEVPAGTPHLLSLSLLP